MRAAIYARVSTHDQQTLPMQINAIRQYLDRRNWPLELLIEDIGSGAVKRIQREKILRAAKRREIDVVVVWKLDRWGRSLPDLVGSLQELTALGVGFISITEAIDLTTPAGKAMAGMLAVFAQFERDLLSERVKAGIAHSISKGNAHGRPNSTATKSDRVNKLKGEGKNISEIARETGMSRTSVRRILAKN